jgi:hypothetical protein
MKGGLKRHLHIHKGGRACEQTGELRAMCEPHWKGGGSDEREIASTDTEDLEKEGVEMSVSWPNHLGRFWLNKFREWTKSGINLRHPTRI